MNPVTNNNYSWYNKKISNGVSVISLITDFGLKDNFVGVIKAVILKINPSAGIIDICHEVKPQDITEAAFLLMSSYNYFPSGTVHLAVVDPGVGSGRKKILVKTKNYFFIGPDNGILSLALKKETPLKIIQITNQRYFLKPVSNTFHGRDIFAPVCAYVSKDKYNIERFGRRIKSFKELELPKVNMTPNSLTGEIIYIDRFGNLISNIDKNILENFVKNKKFKIDIKGRTIDRLSSSYSEGSYLKLIALMDSFNYLEIALNCSSARDYLGVDKGAKIKITRG